MPGGTMETLDWHETTWDGRPAAEVPSPKTTLAVDTVRATGEIEGELTERWLMTYAADGTARFVGLSHLTGAVAGRTGSVVLQHAGRFDAEGLHTEFTIAPGSGTGDLTGISGSGTFAHSGREGEPTRYTIDARFD